MRVHTKAFVSDDVMGPSIHSNLGCLMTRSLISPSSSWSMAADVYLDGLVASFLPSVIWSSWMLETSPMVLPPNCTAAMLFFCAASRVWLHYHAIRLPVFHRLVSKLNVLHQWWGVVSSSLCSCSSALAASTWWWPVHGETTMLKVCGHSCLPIRGFM